MEINKSSEVVFNVMDNNNKKTNVRIKNNKGWFFFCAN